MFVLRSILRVTGPVSRMLQGVGTDLAIASTLIEACINQFRKCIGSVDDAWEKVLSDARAFAAKHGIEPKLHQKRQRKTKKMPGEQCSDERVVDDDQALKVNVYIRSLDTVLVALEDRFSDENLLFLKQIQLFTPKSLSKGTRVAEDDIAELCEFYGLSAVQLARERNDFPMCIPIWSRLSQLTTKLKLQSMTSLRRLLSLMMTTNVNVTQKNQDLMPNGWNKVSSNHYVLCNKFRRILICRLCTKCYLRWQYRVAVRNG
jgi:hypothetical protein